jgi:hypothetical protein
MEGMRQLDEWERIRGSLPALAAQVTLAVPRSDLPNAVHPVTQEVLLLLEIYDRVRDILDHCTHSDYQVLRTLKTLIERGLVQVRRQPDRLDPQGAQLFDASQQRRLRDWLEEQRPRGAPAVDAKLLVASPDAEAVKVFVELLAGLPGMELSDRYERQGCDPADVMSIGRLAVGTDLGLEVVHVPADRNMAPAWPVLAYGALGRFGDADTARGRGAESPARRAGLPRGAAPQGGAHRSRGAPGEGLVAGSLLALPAAGRKREGSRAAAAHDDGTGVPVSALELKGIALFADLAEDELEMLAGLLEERELRPKQQLMAEGAEGEGLLLLMEGKLELLSTARGSLGQLEAPAHLGVASLVAVGPRPMSARATTPTRVMTLTRTAFHRFAEDAPRGAVRVLEAALAELAGLLRSGADLVR